MLISELITLVVVGAVFCFAGYVVFGFVQMLAAFIAEVLNQLAVLCVVFTIVLLTFVLLF